MKQKETLPKLLFLQEIDIPYIHTAVKDFVHTVLELLLIFCTSGSETFRAEDCGLKPWLGQTQDYKLD
jgi:hypothetical protein